MTTIDIVLILVLAGLCLLIVTRKKKSPCSQDCKTCEKGCARIDWEQVRKDIHKKK